MGRNASTTRIEPHFGGPAAAPSTSGFSVSEEDRVVPQPKKRKASPAKKPGPKRQPSTARRSRKRKSTKRRGGLFGLVRGAAYWSLVFGLWAGIAGAGLVVWYGAQMPSATTWTIPDRPPNVRIVSVNGQIVANRGMTGGEAIGLHEMSPYIPQAIIAIEDHRFYSHFGVDPIGLARAMLENAMQGRIAQGGSTLTQQLAKNLFLEPDRTIKRKVQEVLMALWLEHEYTKDQILEMYLNRVYFGSGSYGVEAASRRYFGKSARDVSLSEAALLAGLVKAPSRLSPARDPQAAEARAQLVLAAMRKHGMIGDGELASAISAPAVRAPAYWTGSEHYVADRIMEELPLLIGEVRQDIIVESTVDLVLQTFAEASIRRLIEEKGAEYDVSQAALVSIDASGAVRAMVGGVDYATSQFDRASEARRQPGSAFKPFVFMAALEQGLYPETVRNDTPIRIGDWSPSNYGGKYHGQVTLSEALAKSLNSIAVQLTREVGPEAVVEAAWRMGVESDLDPNLSIALGTSEVTPLELTASYVPFANGGFRPDIHFVRRITTVEGEVLYEHAPSNGPRVISAEVVGMMNAMLAQAVSEGTARKADFGWPAAGKTGTTQNSRDAWFVGYTSNLTTGVWFGNDDGLPTKATGGSLPALAWHEFMTAAHEGVPVAGLPGDWDGRVFSRIEDILKRQDGPQAVPVAAQRGQPAPAMADRTGSIDRPVPPGAVGEAPPPSVDSILGAIFGN